ncbi:MAG: aminotransferase class V-fold PLP-dependent enzyme [Candidatus Omnitrophica bacterium]|nr:aminotransferase class V-fold PLP-dependent enzyme [Candidatus Omnitrophota bacterium]
MYKKIFLDAPNVGELEKKYLNNAIDSGYVSSVGPFVAEFEAEFAKLLGVKKAVSTQSGTTAIHMVLHELGVGKGDEVIVPALTFIASINPVLYVNAKPVFVDIDPVTWNIDAAAVEKAITDKTKVIIAVHLYGNPCNMDQILRIAKKHNIYVIEDAAESLGAKYNGNYTGTLGDFGCFSFNGNKVITTGGGGMIVGNSPKKLEHIKFLANQAKDRSNESYHPEIGFNDRMTNIEAALGLAQLKRLEGFLKKKERFNEIYRNELKSIKKISFQETLTNANSSYWLVCILLKDIDIPLLQSNLKNKGVTTRRIFMPIVEFPPYKRYKNHDYKNSYRIYERGLCLPCSTLNSEDDIYSACKILKGCLR